MNLETRNTEPTKYADLMARARELKSVKPSTLINAKALAKVAGIEFENSQNGPDPRVALYAVLRADSFTSADEAHSGGLTDQKLFAETLQMLGETAALEKFKAAYPLIFPEKNKNYL